MLKKDLRFKYTKLRDGISSQSLSNSSLSIANNALKLPLWEFEYYHLFLPIVEKKEIDTTFILTILQGRDKNVVLPKIESGGILKNFLLTDATKLKKNKWNIPEPVDGITVSATKIDVVFVPLLGFDQQGRRVGYGKGFYDRFLAQCNPNVQKIGLSLFEAEAFITDHNNTDISLDYCITPSKIYSFSEV